MPCKREREEKQAAVIYKAYKRHTREEDGKMQSNHFHESNLISCKLTSWKMLNFVLIVSCVLVSLFVKSFLWRWFVRCVFFVFIFRLCFSVHVKGIKIEPTDIEHIFGTLSYYRFSFCSHYIFMEMLFANAFSFPWMSRALFAATHIIKHQVYNLNTQTRASALMCLCA